MTNAASISLEGVNQVWREIKRFEKRVGPRIAGRMLGAGMRSFAAGVKREIPKTQTPGHSNRRLKKSVGYRYAKTRSGIQSAKFGFRVGRRKANAAPHAHLYVLGTKARTRRRIGGRFARFKAAKRTTGMMPGRPNILKQGVASSINKARRSMHATAKRELNKARRRR